MNMRSVRNINKRLGLERVSDGAGDGDEWNRKCV